MKKGLLSLLVIFVFLAACSSEEEKAPAKTETKAEKPTPQTPPEPVLTKPEGEPDRIAVQHILIAFMGSINKPSVTRSKAEAEALAAKVFEEAKSTDDYDALVKKYTDDSHPGIYAMSNFGIAPNKMNDEMRRDQLIPSFGNVGFKLDKGEVGLAVYDANDSRYGWHIIKRVQ
jgi:hypothetical protein